MCCIPNTRHLEPISSPISQQAKLLRSAVVNGRIYIRPIQKDLDLCPVKDTNEVSDCVEYYKQLSDYSLRN